MIKYVELTAPNASAFRQAKILSIECQEGEVIKEGDTLFKVQSGSHQINLPAIKAGRVVEIIVSAQESITLSTALLLLETKVSGPTASRPITDHSNIEVSHESASDVDTMKPVEALKETSQKIEINPPVLNDQTSFNLDSGRKENTTNETITPAGKMEKAPEVVLTQTVTTHTDSAVKNILKKSPTMPSSSIEVTVPDIGADSAKVIEILVNVGDSVAAEDPLLTLESDKASMDVPSTHEGVIKSIKVALDQDVSEGTVIMELEVVATQEQETPKNAVDSELEADVETPKVTSKTTVTHSANSTPEAQTPKPAEPVQVSVASTVSAGKSHASPSVRRFARELGVDLTQLSGSGRKGRITQDNVKEYVKSTLLKPSSVAPLASSGSGIPAVPAQDFSKFGDIDIQPLNKIKKLTAANLHRAWLNVPHVTHNDESNINDLEAFRKQLNAEYAKTKQDIKLSPLAFIVKAMVNALQRFPQFNSSLEPGGENLIYKKYFNIGIAVETPNGLVVPVLKEADKKSVAEIATEMGELAKKARDKKLTMNDMSGACITISSLGGIGGTGFTPIVNTPEVAILGVSRSKIQPVWNGTDFEPGMILPLSLSYDHRVIDGAEAARFTRHIAALLEDIRRLTV